LAVNGQVKKNDVGGILRFYVKGKDNTSFDLTGKAATLIMCGGNSYTRISGNCTLSATPTDGVCTFTLGHHGPGGAADTAVTGLYKLEVSISSGAISAGGTHLATLPFGILEVLSSL
jgi:hypothetical protein